jgi:hypothetical protein
MLKWIAKKQGLVTSAHLLGLLVGSSDCFVHGTSNQRFGSVRHEFLDCLHGY